MHQAIRPLYWQITNDTSEHDGRTRETGRRPHGQRTGGTRRIEEENVDFLRLQFTDILGVVKNVSVPAHQAEKAFTEGIYFDGSSIEGFVRIQESDMRLVPDPDTFVRGAPVAQRRRGRLRGRSDHL